MASLAERVESVRARWRRLVGGWRVRWLWLDHLMRTVQRYQFQGGDRLAGAVTYFAFLSFFPLIALAFAVVGKVLADNPGISEALDKAIREQLPGLARELDLPAIKKSRTTAGLIGLVGLLYAGLGALDALRGALREIYMTTTPPLNFFLAKLRDLATLLMIGVTMLVSVAVNGFTTQATDTVTSTLGLGQSLLAEATVWLGGSLAGVIADWVMFIIVLGWVARPVQPFRVIARGALIGAFGFLILKHVASRLLGSTLDNPIYGTFAVIVGLLVWINFSARLTLYVAAWTATAGLCPPPSPTPVPTTTNGA